MRAKDKLCICGKNGVGKSTLLRLIRDTLEKRADLRVFYMPQDPGGLLDPRPFARRAALPFGRKGRAKPRRAAAGQHEIHRRRDEPSMRRAFRRAKAKLMFLMMAESRADVLLLDEPTRNLSPLSGPVVRNLFADYPGCIIAVSHDRRFVEAVCTRAVRLEREGAREAPISGVL